MEMADAVTDSSSSSTVVGGARGGGGLGRATIDVSEIISPLTNFLLSIGVTRGIITLLKSNVVINTFDLHVLSKKPVHEGQKSSSPHNFTIAASSLHC